MLWQAQMLRLTLFPLKPGAVAPDTWWKEVIGEEPDRIDKRPKRGTMETSGQYGTGRMVLQVEPNRIDWLYLPLGESDPTELLGAFSDCLVLFSNLMNRWFDMAHLPALGRVALGAVLRMPVESREGGYAILQPLLKSVQIREGVSDFFYQINLPTQLSLGSETAFGINRLTRWTVAAVETMNANLGPALPLGRVSTVTEMFAQAELDINTVPNETTVIDPSDLSLLLSKLSAMSVNIADSGEPE